MQGAGHTRTQDGLEEAVRGAQGGDVSAFAQLYEHFYDQIFRYVSFKVGSVHEAEDITEEVFLRMLESVSSFKFQGSPFSSWLFRIAHNLVVDYYRKSGRANVTDLDAALAVKGDNAADMDRQMDVELQMRQVDHAMRGLTDLQKEVISLRFAGGLSINETASAVGKKVNVVKALQHAGIKSLRRRLGVGDVGFATSASQVSPGGLADG